ncbi:unnamed protein product [Sphagnum compactum]
MPDVAGWLQKKSKTSNTWKRRFFLLQSSNLFFFATNHKIEIAEPMGVIPLEGAKLEETFDLALDMPRKWCFELRLGKNVAEFAACDNYVLAAPSQQAMDYWMHQELKNARERGGILRALLAESPSNLNALESAKGPEAKVLQSEIARVTEKYKKLKAKAEQACANSDKLKKVTIRALAVWEILTDHVSGTHLELKQLMKSITPGKNSVGTCRTMTRMQMEANTTLDLFKLLQTKEQLLEGGVKYVRFLHPLLPSRHWHLQSNKQVPRAAAIAMPKRVRALAPRYAGSIHPALLPADYVDPLGFIPSSTFEQHRKESIQRRSRTDVARLNRASLHQQRESGRGSLNLKTELQDHQSLQIPASSLEIPGPQKKDSQEPTRSSQNIHSKQERFITHQVDDEALPPMSSDPTTTGGRSGNPRNPSRASIREQRENTGGGNFNSEQKSQDPHHSLRQSLRGNNILQKLSTVFENPSASLKVPAPQRWDSQDWSDHPLQPQRIPHQSLGPQRDSSPSEHQYPPQATYSLQQPEEYYQQTQYQELTQNTSMGDPWTAGNMGSTYQDQQQYQNQNQPQFWPDHHQIYQAPAPYPGHPGYE